METTKVLTWKFIHGSKTACVEHCVIHTVVFMHCILNDAIINFLRTFGESTIKDVANNSAGK